MPDIVRAAILSLGTEITSGIIKDTHGRFLGAELTAMGVQVEKSCQMRDDPAVIPMVQEMVRGHQLVLITGGLGPTSDDLTREAIAEAAGVRLRFDADLWELLKERYGLSKAEANRKQAMIPEGFHVVPNPQGTAPGLWGRVDGCMVCAMPGPPRELEPMFLTSVRPVIAEELQLELVAELEASTFLIPEAVLEDVCRKYADGVISWRTRFQAYKISLYLSGGSGKDQEVFLSSLKEHFGYGLVQEGDIDPAAALFETLKEKGLRLATAESCTGGLIGALLTDIAGVSACYWGGFITYDNEAKIHELNVDGSVLERFGAVSEEAVLQMASGALGRSDADIAVAVSGIAGPEGGTPDKPVGTVWIALAGSDGKQLAWKFDFGSRRSIIRRRTAVAAFLLTDLALREPNRLDMVNRWHYS